MQRLDLNLLGYERHVWSRHRNWTWTTGGGVEEGADEEIGWFGAILEVKTSFKSVLDIFLSTEPYLIELSK